LLKRHGERSEAIQSADYADYTEPLVWIASSLRPRNNALHEYVSLHRTLLTLKRYTTKGKKAKKHGFLFPLFRPRFQDG
jgi:hypothetical protein